MTAYRPAVAWMIAACIGAAGCSRGGSSLAGERPSVDLVYVATAGVGTPWIVPINQSGAPGEPRRIAPIRGAGYGLGEGAIVVLGSTPRADRLVIFFQTLSKAGALFTVAADGSSREQPLLIARLASPLGVDPVISPDGARIAYLDGNTLFTAALDGSETRAPVRLAAPSPEATIRRMRWSGDRVLFEIDRDAGGNTTATIHSVRADGSQADHPIALTQPDGGQHRMQAILPDGRVLALLRGGPLFALSANGAVPPVRLTPEGIRATLIGVTGPRVIVELWTGSADYARRLASVAADGAEADRPVVFTPDPLQDLQALLSPDGSRVIYLARGPNQRWAVFDVPANAAPAAGDDGRITAWLSNRIHLGEVTPDARAIAACDEDGHILRVERTAGPAAEPAIIAESRRFSRSCALRGLVPQTNVVLYFDADQEIWAVPIGGGTPSRVSRGYAHPIEGGALYIELDRKVSAIFRSGRGKRPVALTPWLDREIDRALTPSLASNAGTVLYATRGAEEAWYAASIDGSDAGALRRITPLGTKTADESEVGGRLVARILGPGKGARIGSFAIDGSDQGGAVPVLELSSARASFLVAPGSGRIVTVLADRIVSARVDGSDHGSAVPVLDTAGGFVSAIALEPSTERVLAAVRTKGGSAVFAAAANGTELRRPTVVARDPGLVNDLVVATGGEPRLLMTLATQDTAVPHPRAVLTMRTNGANVGLGHVVPLAPEGFILLGTVETGRRSKERRLAVTPDGRFALLRGRGGLHAAAADGSEHAAPRLLLSATDAVPLDGAGFSPSGTALAVTSGERLFVVRPARAAQPGTPVASRGAARFTSGLWSKDGALVIYRTGNFGDDGVIFVAPADGSGAARPRRLTPAEVPAGELIALTPDGSAVVFQSAIGGDRSLYLAGVETDPPIVPRAPVPLTPIDDAAERLVGFVR